MGELSYVLGDYLERYDYILQNQCQKRSFINFVCVESSKTTDNISICSQIYLFGMSMERFPYKINHTYPTFGCHGNNIFGVNVLNR